MFLLQRKVRHYRDELDIYDDAEDGTPELKMKRLKTTSKYLSSFEGIPRAKMMETSLDNNLQDVSVSISSFNFLATG